MPTKRFISRLSLCVLLATSATFVFAAYRELDAPRLTLARGYPEADYKKVQAVLTRDDCKYLGGAELNAFTSLRYAGDTVALNRFIEALSLCPNLTVHVMFERPHGGAVEHDWMVTQRAPSNQLEVRINLASEKIKLESLYLPPVKAEKASE